MDDSVLLYEHYINDDQWERTLAFPRGGLTYLISNGTIKFYAYEDYFYRNCLISMQLPIYIVDEYMHIDGEYDDLDELVEILDRIFPTNDIDAQLDKYLKKIDADLLYQPIGDYLTKTSADTLYQPIGDYVTTDELVEALEDYYTKDEADARFQPIGEYLTSGDTYLKGEIDDKLDDKLDASAYTPCDLSNYYTKQETSSKTQIDTALARKADNDKVYTKTESDAKYQIKLVAGDNITISGNVISASGGGGEPVDAYTKAESDARYQPKGNYATEQWVLNQKYITSSSTVFNNYYTKTELNNRYYTKNEVNNIITNIQNQISALTEALNECCSGTPTPTVEYRWVEMTGASDFVCSGYDKYAKEKKQKSTDGGATWTDVTPAEYRQGSRLIENDSADCGYDSPLKFSGALRNSSTIINVPCDGSSILTEPEVHNTRGYASIQIGDCVTEIGEETFQNEIAISSVTIPSGVTTIGKSAFADVGNSSSVTAFTITFNEGLVTIGQGAFFGCRNYSALTIPNSVTTIGSSAFAISKIKNLTIGSGISFIGNGAFSKSEPFESITIYATTPPTIETYNVFWDDTNTCPIYVPAASVNAYKTANIWSQYYADRIQAIPS